MDMGFIVAPCSRLGRAGSLSHAGRGAQALQVLAGEASTAQPRRTPMGARSSAAPDKDERGGDGEKWAMAEGEEGERGYGKGIVAGRFPVSLAPPGRAFLGTSGVLGRAVRTRPCPGRGKCPGVPESPRGLRRLLPPSCPLPTGLMGKKNPRHYEDTFLIPWDVILPPYKRF